MLSALLAIAALFGLLFLTRIGRTQWREALARWPSLLLAGAAMWALTRGQVALGALLAVAAAGAWTLWPQLRSSGHATNARPSRADPADAEARAILGVGADATPAQIRAAYREKMTRAHPDRGGSHAEATRLTAARDRLLRSRR